MSIGLGGEARVVIRMEHQGKQDLEVFSWDKEHGGLLVGSLRTASFWSGGVGSRDKSCHWDGASRSATGFSAGIRSKDDYWNGVLRTTSFGSGVGEAETRVAIGMEFQSARG